MGVSPREFSSDPPAVPHPPAMIVDCRDRDLLWLLSPSHRYDVRACSSRFHEAAKEF